MFNFNDDYYENDSASLWLNLQPHLSATMDCEAVYVPLLKVKKINVLSSQAKSKSKISCKKSAPKAGAVKAKCVKDTIAKKPACMATTMVRKAIMSDTCVPSMTKLRLGSDCTGYNAASIAMETIRLPHTQMFSPATSMPMCGLSSPPISISTRFSRIALPGMPLWSTYTQLVFRVSPIASKGRTKDRTTSVGPQS